MYKILKTTLRDGEKSQTYTTENEGEYPIMKMLLYNFASALFNSQVLKRFDNDVVEGEFCNGEVWKFEIVEL